MSLTEAVGPAGIVLVLKTCKPLHYIKEYGPVGSLGVPNRSCRSFCHNLGYKNFQAPSSHQGIDLGGAWMFLTEYLGPAGISWVLKTHKALQHIKGFRS